MPLSLRRRLALGRKRFRGRVTASRPSYANTRRTRVTYSRRCSPAQPHNRQASPPTRWWNACSAAHSRPHTRTRLMHRRPRLPCGWTVLRAAAHGFTRPLTAPRHARQHWPLGPRAQPRGVPAWLRQLVPQRLVALPVAAPAQFMVNLS